MSRSAPAMFPSSKSTPSDSFQCASRTNANRIARSTGQQILQNKGVIRGLANWGQFDLPHPTTKHQTQHYTGHYFIMQFDSSSATQSQITRSLRLDPRMIRHSIVKIGDKLGGVNNSIEDVDGKIPWKVVRSTEPDYGFGTALSRAMR